MATFDKLSLALVKEKGLLIYADCRPADLWQQLITASDDQYKIRSSGVALRCPHCNYHARNNAGHCWKCTRVLLNGGKANYSLTVKLASNGIPVRGPVSAALAFWNPCCLNLRIQEFGFGTEFKVAFSGFLSTGELVLFIVICSALSIALCVEFYKYKDYFHCAVAIFLFIFGPIGYFALRKKQEQDLIDFVKERLPQLVPHRPYSKQAVEMRKLDYFYGRMR